jgi:signal transduction histidine kinase
VRAIARVQEKLTKEEAEKERLSSIIKIISHDIANPLTVIMGNAEFGSAKTLGKPENSYFKKIQRATKMIEDILHRTRHLEAVRTGKIAPKRECFDIAAVLVEVDFLFRTRISSKSLDFQMKFGGELTDGTTEMVGVIGDKVLLTYEVISNILSNALKFTSEGGSVSVNVWDRDDSVLIEIDDTGLGIPSSLMPYTFSSTYRTSRMGTQNEGGTGFGLPLAHKMLGEMGGRISVASPVPGTFRGTRVSIQLEKSSEETQLQISA